MHRLSIKSSRNITMIEILGEKTAIESTEKSIEKDDPATSISMEKTLSEIEKTDTLNDYIRKVKPIFEDSQNIAVIRYQKGHFFPTSKEKLLEGVGNDEKGEFTRKFLDNIVVTDKFELLSSDMWYSSRGFLSNSMLDDNFIKNWFTAHLDKVVISGIDLSTYRCMLSNPTLLLIVKEKYKGQ